MLNEETKFYIGEQIAAAHQRFLDTGIEQEVVIPSTDDFHAWAFEEPGVLVLVRAGALSADDRLVD